MASRQQRRALARTAAKLARRPERPSPAGDASFSAQLIGPPGADIPAPPADTMTVATPRGGLVVPLEGCEHLRPPQLEALRNCQPIMVHRRLPPDVFLARVPRAALAAVFISEEPAASAEWTELAWHLRAESLRQEPKRVTFFYPVCAFQQLPGPPGPPDAPGN